MATYDVWGFITHFGTIEAENNKQAMDLAIDKYGISVEEVRLVEPAPRRTLADFSVELDWYVPEYA